MLKVRYTSRFKKDFKLMKKRGYDIKLFEEVLNLLVQNEPLPGKYLDHQLIDNHKGFRECHILPDWLLIYKTEEDTLTRTGTHSDLF